MNTINRLMNAYSSGGIKEVFRKLYYYIIYKKNGKKIVSQVMRQDYEFGVLRNEHRDIPVIVSLTTYPKRFSDIELCLKSLILQKTKPDHIIVYLGSDSVNIDLPDKMKFFENYGVEFKYDTTNNIKSYKKFFYAMQEYPDAIVVTVDDDIIYPSDLLTSLLDSYRKYPNAISARRVHLMTLKGGELAPYNSWVDQYRQLKTPSHALFATGGGGILYPPHSLDLRAFEQKVFMNICPTADDVWLKCMAFLNGYPIVWVPNNVVDLPEVKNSYVTALQNSNVGDSMNDLFLKKVIERFDIEAQDFFD